MKPRRFAQVGFVVACVLASFRLEAATASFAVYLEFDQKTNPPALKIMQQEVARIFAPAALEPIWRTRATRQTGEDLPHLLFVRLHGICAANSKPARANHSGLASTAVSQGRILPFTDIDCSELRRFLDTAIIFSAAPEMLFERALGRVLAHEAFHFLAATKMHGENGVAQSAYRLQDLTAPELDFNAPELALLRLRQVLIITEAPRLLPVKP